MRIPARDTPYARPAGARPVRHVVAFFVLTYLLTWLAWVPAGLAARGVLELHVPGLVLLVVGGLGPLVAAVAVATWSRGRAGVAALFRQLDPRRTAKRWYAAALLLLPVNLAPAAWVALTTADGPSTGDMTQALAVLPFQVVFVALVGGGLDEEMGWRAFALPALLGRRHVPVLVNVGLGVAWALWHLPLWLDPASAHAAYPVWLYVLKTVGLSVLIGWMYAGSGGSLLVAVLAHAVSNSADGARYQLLGERSADLDGQLVLTAATLAAAAAVTYLTRGRLGADRLRAPAPDRPSRA